jgi:hypothetical protein
MDNITIIFDHDDVKTTLIVRNKNGSKLTSNNYNIVPHVPINTTLEILGLERVPFNELVPRHKQIKLGDKVLGSTCSICQDEYQIKEYKRELSCGHLFHKKCIDKWLKTNLTCPFCRDSISGNKD